VKYQVLDYLLSNKEADNTINSVAQAVNVTRHQARASLDNLEYMGLVNREPKMLPDSAGVMRRNFVYQACGNGRRADCSEGN
jgi:predicted transcriptional regulator